MQEKEKEKEEEDCNKKSVSEHTERERERGKTRSPLDCERQVMIRGSSSPSLDRHHRILNLAKLLLMSNRRGNSQKMSSGIKLHGNSEVLDFDLISEFMAILRKKRSSYEF